MPFTLTGHANPVCEIRILRLPGYNTYCPIGTYLFRYKHQPADTEGTEALAMHDDEDASLIPSTVCLVEGPGSVAFAITFVVAAITAYDATGVRQHSGRQASVINAIVVNMPPEVRHASLTHMIRMCTH